MAWSIDMLSNTTMKEGQEGMRMVTALQTLHDNAFETRDRSLPVPNVQVGSYVKVGIRGERFWCRVSRERADGSILAIIDNFLLRSPWWQRGDEIVLQRSHVLEAADYGDELMFRSLWATLGSISEAAMAWRANKDECLNENARKHRWFVMPK
jgi:hypothetical protein